MKKACLICILGLNVLCANGMEKAAPAHRLYAVDYTETILASEAAHGKNLATLKELIEKETSAVLPDVKSDYLSGALFAAVSNRRYLGAAVLLSKGADPRAIVHELGTTAFAVAKKMRDKRMIRVINAHTKKAKHQDLLS